MGDFYGTGIEIWAGFGPNGRLLAHFDVSKIYEILKIQFKFFIG